MTIYKSKNDEEILSNQEKIIKNISIIQDSPFKYAGLCYNTY